MKTGIIYIINSVYSSGKTPDDTQKITFAIIKILLAISYSNFFKEKTIFIVLVFTSIYLHRRNVSGIIKLYHLIFQPT